MKTLNHLSNTIFLLIITGSLFNPFNSYSQDPIVQWDNTIGGIGTEDLKSASKTSDGGYIIGGSSSTNINGDKTELCKGSLDYWIIKLDALGNIVWQNTIGSSSYDYLVEVVEAPDGGYLVAGHTIAGISVDKTTESFGGYDFWILKLTPTGEIVWQKEIGGSGNDYLTHAYAITGGGFILGGYSDSGISGLKTQACIGEYDYWILKINSVGTIQWQYTIGGTGDDYLKSSKKSSTGNYILAGYSESGIGGDKEEACIGSRDYWIMSMTPAGNILWQNTIGGTGYDELMDFVELESNNIILAGHSDSDISGDKSELSHNRMADTEFYDEEDMRNTDDLWIVKIDSDGDIIWEKTFGADYKDEYVVNAFAENDNRIIIAGGTLSYDSYISRYYTVAIDTNGYVIWTDEIYGQYEEDGWEDGVYNFEDNDLRAAFNIPGDGYMLAGSSSGNIGYDKTEDAWATGYGVGYNSDYWIVKMGPDTCTTSPLYTDFDLDGSGGLHVAEACELVNKPYVFTSGDCNDMHPSIYFDAEEVCDGKDNNCNGIIDEGLLDCNSGPEILWDITLGGTDTDRLNATAISLDGSIFLGGTTGSISDEILENNGGLDLTIFKLDADGNILWNVVYGGSADDELQSINLTSDNGLIVGAYSYSGISGDKTEANYGNRDYWIIKLDADGNLVWQNSIGGSSSDDLSVIRQTIDGGYILGGTSYSGLSGEKTEASYGVTDFWIIKLDALGNIVWQNTIGGSSSDDLTSLFEMPDGSFVIGGSSGSGISGEKTVAGFGSYDYWVIKLSSAGTITWQKVFGGSSSDELTSLEKSYDNNILVCGYSSSGISGNKTEISYTADYWILKLNATGGIIWQNTINGEDVDNCFDIAETYEHNIVITGHSKSMSQYDKEEKFIHESPMATYYSHFDQNDYDYWVTTLNASGELIWQNTIGGNMNDYATSVSLTPSGQILIGGYSSSFISADKSADPNGFPEEIDMLTDYPYSGIFGDYDFWIVLMEPDGCVPSTETCNSNDDNCNGLIDEGVVETISISAGGPIIFCQGGNVLLTATYSGATVQWRKNGTNIAGAISSTYSVTKTGDYTCVTTSPCGTATSSIIHVIVNKNPAASITAGGATTFCAGGSVTLIEVPVTGCSYQWYKGASTIAGATSTNYIATTAGNYKCRVTKTASGCFKNSNTIVVTVPCKEGEELLAENNNFTIFPNPNNGTFNLVFNSQFGGASPLEGGPRGVTTLEIFNSLGQLIYSKQIHSADGNINETITIDNLSSGIYFVRLSNGNNYSEQKLIIE